MAFHPLGSAKMSATTRATAWSSPRARRGHVDNLFVADGSVLPTSIGVNSQLPIMSISMMLAQGICADWDRLQRRAA